MRSRYALLSLCAVGLIGCGGQETLNQQSSGPLLQSWNSSLAQPLLATGQAPAPPSGAAAAADVNLLAEIRTNPGAGVAAGAARFDVGAVQAWNQIAREIVIAKKMDPPMASRLYTMLSMAQYDAALAAMREQARYGRSAPYLSVAGVQRRASAPVTSFSYPSTDAAIAEASAAVIEAVVPDQASLLEDFLRIDNRSRVTGGVAFPSDIDAGSAIGSTIGAATVNHFATDGSGAIWTGSVPTGPGKWFSSVNLPPLRPLWGTVRTTAIDNVDVIPVTPPPAFGSAEFNAALAEVRQISNTRTAAQDAIAKQWAYGSGTSTPPGVWNEIACGLFDSSVFPGDDAEVRKARVLAYMNMAMFDAGIVCWKAKFDYWLIRPSQADPAITLSVGLPNFPAYSSGHSSFSSAAAEVLTAALPMRGPEFRSMAAEAAISRVYGGIHYRFDSDEGMRCGAAVGEIASAKLLGQ